MIKSHLKVVLAKNEMTQLELSKRTGVRQPTISAIATNTAKHIPLDVLDSICRELNCQPADLFEYISD